MRMKGPAVAAFSSFIATALSLTSGVAAQTAGEATARPGVNGLSVDDDRAVREIVAGFEKAWNTHDMKALEKLFRDDAEWVNVVGMHWRGRDEIMVAHTAFHQTMFKNHSYRTDAVETRVVAPGVVVAVATETFGSVTTPDGKVRPTSRDRLSYVLVKGPEGWKIAHGHNVVIDEEATKHDPVRHPRD